jgi:hypothetical protein
MLYVPEDKTDSVYVYFSRENGTSGGLNIFLQDEDIYFYTYSKTAEGSQKEDNFFYAQKIVRPDILKEIKRRIKKFK